MKPYRIVIMGHRNFSEHQEIEKKLCSIMEKEIEEKDYLEIYIGRNGEFDVFAASVIKYIQRKKGKERIEISLILPYEEKNMIYYEDYYDSVCIPESVMQLHPKGAIRKRNEWMIAHADCLLCYVKENYGGAYQAMKYAQKINKEIINLAK